MKREEAIETISREWEHSGVEKIVAALQGDPPPDAPDGELGPAIDVLGEDRVRQLLGLDGELWYTVYSIRGSEDAREKRDEVVDRLDALWDDGKIADYDTQTVPSRTKPGQLHTDAQLEEAFRAYNGWAARHDLTLDPFFRTEKGGDEYVFPDVFLVVRSQRGRLYSLPTSDRDTSGLVGVFPCADGATQYSVADYLSAVEAGVDWREWTESEAPSSPDWGAHGAIKGRLFEDPGETVGEEWVVPSDEVWVTGSSEDDVGQVDIVFEHESKSEYLLVEIKPERSKVDSAFGQIGRYKYQFLANSDLPHLSPEDVHLTIAAPDFHDSHRRVAEEWGVELVEVPVVGKR